jgi:hypothetical protein
VLRQPHLLAAKFPPTAKNLLEQLGSELRSARTCMWPKCGGTARESHVISETFLRFIAENGEVMGPRNPEVSVAHDVPLVKAWRTRSATTFPGYCEDHEKKFAVFENDPPRRVATPEHVRLQLCRTVASEVQDRRDLAKALNRLGQAYPAEFAEAGLLDAQERVKRHLSSAQVFLVDLHVDLDHGGESFGLGDRVAVEAIPYPDDLDLALSYLDFATVRHLGEGGEWEVPLAIALFPHRPSPGVARETMFLLASPNRAALNMYVSMNVTPDPPLRLLQLAETWMREGCFTWWTRPSWWAASEHRRNAIEAAALKLF